MDDAGRIQKVTTCNYPIISIKSDCFPSQLDALVELESEVGKLSSEICLLTQKRKMKILEIANIKAELVSLHLNISCFRTIIIILSVCRA